MGTHLPPPDWFGAVSVAAQDGDLDSTLEFYRRALHWRRQLTAGSELAWADAGPDVVSFSRDRWLSVTNFGSGPMPLPAGDLVLASAPLVAGELPAETTAWLTAP